jgi:hypothetical protein
MAAAVVVRVALVDHVVAEAAAAVAEAETVEPHAE